MPLNNPVQVKAVITGTYAGDGSTNRQIATGFKVSHVVIIGKYTNQAIHVVIPSKTLIQDAATTIDASTQIEPHATNGFIVGKTNAGFGNINLEDYYYWAVSE